MKMRAKFFSLFFRINVFAVLIVVCLFVTMEIFHTVNSEKRYLNTLSSYFISDITYSLFMFEESLKNAFSDVDFQYLIADDEIVNSKTKSELKKKISSFGSYFPYAEVFQVKYVQNPVFSYRTENVSIVDLDISYSGRVLVFHDNKLYLVRSYKPNEDIEVLFLFNLNRFVSDFFTNHVLDENRGIMFSFGNIKVFSFKTGTEAMTKRSFIFSDESIVYGVKVSSVVPIDVVYKSIRPIVIFGTAILCFLLLAIFILSRQLSKKLSMSFETVLKEIQKRKGMDFEEIESLERYEDELKWLVNYYNEISREYDNYIKETDRIVQEKTAVVCEQNAFLKEISTIDSLTGLHNRRYFDENFPKEFNIARREGFYVNFAIIDIDDFKNINDKYGHLCGDACLTALATIIRKCFQRTSDEFERFGGEEFTIYNVSRDSEDFLKYLNFFREEVAKVKVKCEAYDCCPVEVSFTVSIGAVSFIPKYSDTFERVISKADANLYIAKNTGKNKVVLQI
ncbi:MAG: GGDEF domain-containing protein [Fervidobacterium sp.]|uniref:GGDEF domain-containing protein n=1 Tax=Fervidobacterium sp. TaxID=1871331 RepID=UPI00404AB719